MFNLIYKKVIVFLLAVVMMIPFPMIANAATTSTLTVSNYSVPNESNLYFAGGAYAFSGVISSNYNIKIVDFSIYKSTGALVYGICINPNTTSYSLSKLSNYCNLSNLTSGSYIYRVKATDSSGVCKTLINKSFVIRPSTFVLKNKSYALQCQDQDDHVGHVDYSYTDFIGCASYCAAYINSILNQTVCSPKSYWATPTDSRLVWSKANMTSSYCSSSYNELRKALNELLAGRPTMIHVYYKTKSSSSEHWVVVVGYTGVSGNANTLTTANFNIIDPFDGSECNLGSKFYLKSDLRIGYKL